MHVEALGIEDFRNFEREQLRLGGGLSLVVGRNAQGKTNLLEAIYCLGGLGSPRGGDAALVREGREQALLHAEVVSKGRKVRVDLELRARGSRALINSTPAPSLGALSEVCVCVFFGPDELSLVKGSPEGRRRFLDDLVVKLHPAREPIRREWERVLRQRNALLKTLPRDPSRTRAGLSTLEVWDESLCRAGTALTVERLRALTDLAPYASKRYSEVAGGGRLELSYASSWLATAGGGGPTTVIDPATIEEALRRAVAENRERELERRISLVGPQRDDVSVGLASAGDPAGILRDARTYGSQGDQRTCALALKLGEHDLITDACGHEPILLLDDVFSELDPARRSWLGDAVRSMEQTILTSAEPGAFESAGPARVVEVAAGMLTTDD